MIYIGNYKELITENLMSHIKSHNGDTTPVWQPYRWKDNPLLEEALERAREGYSQSNHYFQQFNEKSNDMKEFNIVLPKLTNDNRQILWWIIKLLPGQMQPMHFDPHLIDIKNPKRYTMFLEDFKPGHIFVWEDNIITNYKAGDLYQWVDPLCYHGCVNIGYDNRYTLQLTTFDSN